MQNFRTCLFNDPMQTTFKPQDRSYSAKEAGHQELVTSNQPLFQSRSKRAHVREASIPYDSLQDALERRPFFQPCSLVISHQARQHIRTTVDRDAGLGGIPVKHASLSHGNQRTEIFPTHLDNPAH